MLIGYARVSTHDQTLNQQLDALKQAGCDKTYTDTDTISGTKAQRSGLQQALDQLRVGDSLVVWRLGRLGRTLKHLITTVNDLSSAYTNTVVDRSACHRNTPTLPWCAE